MLLTKTLLLVPVLALALTACGGGGADSPEPPSMSGSASATSALGTGVAPAASNAVMPAAAITIPSFWGDWESGTVTGSGNHNWGYIEAVAPERFTILSDGGARQGIHYARVEVRPGDNPIAPISSRTERAEISAVLDASNNQIYENLDSGTQQYSFSVKFDPSWQAIVDYGPTTGNWTGAWGIFLQLHGPNASNPAWALSASEGAPGTPDKIRLNTRLGDMTTNQIVVHELSDGSLNPGQWIDFILTIKYAKDNTGYITLMRRNEGQTDFTQVLSLTNTPTLQYDPNVNNGAVGGHYIKHGLYRNAQPFTSVLYLDGFARTAVPSAL